MGEFLDRCTGVFISSTALLTAGHCVLNKGDIRRAVLEDTGESSTSFTTHPKYTMAAGLSGLLQNGFDVAKASHSEYDLAVIKFQSRQREIFKIGAQGRLGDTVTIIGYGDTENITTTVRANYKKMASAEREAYMQQGYTPIR
jgi:V8-like Glu-specific endopeptidase